MCNCLQMPNMNHPGVWTTDLTWGAAAPQAALHAVAPWAEQYPTTHLTALLLRKSPINISRNIWMWMLNESINYEWRLVEPSLRVPVTPPHEGCHFAPLCFSDGEAAIWVAPMPGLQWWGSWLIEEKKQGQLPSHSQKYILRTLTAHCKTPAKSENLFALKLEK